MTIGGPSRSALERRLTAPIRFTAEVWAMLGILVVAAGLRFWDLGSQALHHDESIHAQWAWRLVQGDYVHSPVFHGPFYYHFQGLIFLLFGATDYTSRVSAAITGLAIIVLVVYLRPWLGRLGVVSAAALLAVSPTIVYYSRFFREDIYFAFFTLLTAVAMWRYIGSGRDRWLVVFAIGIAGAFTTKEAAFLTSAIFLLYLNAYLASELAKETLQERGTDVPWRRFMFAAALFPYAWAIVAVWPLIKKIRDGAAWTKMPRSGDLLVLQGTLILPLLAAALKNPLEKLGVFPDRSFDYPAICNAGGADLLRLAGVFAVVGSAAALVGLQWRPKIWGIAAGSAALIYLTLMTSFWTNLPGLCTGAWGSLDYWIAQQDVQRGNQPWFYYNMLMPSYEFLPLIVAVAGLWWSVVRGNAFTRFLVFWVVGMWIALSAAGEKMPWLNTHIALPTILLAGWTISRAWRSWTSRPPNRDAAIALGSLGFVAAVGFWFVVFDAGDSIPTAAVIALRLSGAAAIVVALGTMIARFGRPAVPAMLVMTLVGSLAFFSVQTMVRASFVRGDTPDDLLIYTQTSPDVARIAGQIDALAEASGLGFDLRIAVDSVEARSWPWAWYLRDYRAVRYLDMQEGPPEGDFDVLLVAAQHEDVVNGYLATTAPDRFAAPIFYPHRWWFREGYKEALPGTLRSGETWNALWDGVSDGGWLTTWFKFWRDKEPLVEPGSTDSAVYFPANFNLETEILEVRPLVLPEPSTDGSGRVFFGGVGGQQGRFFSPIDLDVDVDGNLYVVDSTAKRLSKFDSTGRILATVDVRDDPGVPQDSVPWGLTVLDDGRVVVADTFGWRVRVFTAELQPITSFGQPPAMDGNPGEFELFGPRDTAMDSLGRLWVTDTGHHRLMVYGPDFSFVMQVGEKQGTEPGQFSEPVGIDISPAGEVFVADMYNSRVQVLDLDGAFLREFFVPGWGGVESIDKPYLQVLADGRIALSVPLSNEVRIYSPSGELEVTIAPVDEPLARPYGIVESADGRIWIVENEAARVRQFEVR